MLKKRKKRYVHKLSKLSLAFSVTSAHYLFLNILMVNSLKITHPVLLTSVQAFGTGSVPNSAKGFWMSSSCLESFCSTQRSSLTSFFRPSIVFLTVNILCMDIWSDLNLTVASSVSCWIMAVCLSAILALHSYNGFITCFHEFWIYETWFFPHEI